MGKTYVNNNIKLKSGGGILNDITEGFYADQNNIFTNKVRQSMTAGENLVAGNAVFVSSGADTIITQSTANERYSTTTAAYWYAQTFIATGETVKSVKLWIGDQGGDNNRTVTISLRATSAGLPTGADLESKTVTGTASTVNGQEMTFTFSTPVTVTRGTTYAIIFRCLDTNGQVQVWGNSAAGYSGGSKIASTNSGSSWSAETGKDFYFIVTQTLTADKLYKTSASSSDQVLNNYVGLIETNTNSGATGNIIFSGIFTTSGLTTGTVYYLSDTFGAISSSAGTNSKKIGMALSSTLLLLRSDN